MVLSLCVYLNHLLQNTEKLQPFVISYDYINYNLISYYRNNSSKNNYTSIFDIIKKVGFVSSSEVIFDSDNKIREEDFKNISFLKLVKKFFSKKIRSIFK